MAEIANEETTTNTEEEQKNDASNNNEDTTTNDNNNSSSNVEDSNDNNTEKGEDATKGDDGTATTNDVVQGDDNSKVTENTTGNDPDRRPETYKVYIGNVDRNCNMEDLKAELESFGPMQNWYPKAGFVFVHYLSKEAADKCIAKMRGDTRFSYHHSGLKADISAERRNGQSRSRHIMVRGFPVDVQEDEIKSCFNNYGEVENIKVLNKHPNYDTVACFIDFADAEGAVKALETMDGESKQIQFRGTHQLEVKAHGNERGNRNGGFRGGNPRFNRGNDRGYNGGGYRGGGGGYNNMVK